MQMLNLLGPGFKVPAELAFNKSLFTGAPIYGSDLPHPRNPISGIAADILSNIPGTDVGMTARKYKSGMTRGPGASPFVTYIASQLPLTNILVNQMADIKRAQRGGSDKSLLSYLAGISTYAPDQEQQLGIASQAEQKNFAQFLRGLRDAGLYPESKRKRSKFDKKREKLLEQLLGQTQ
jgi:hypothetical protein